MWGTIGQNFTKLVRYSGVLDSFLGHLLKAFLADILAAVVLDVFRVTAENASRFVLLENDFFLVDIDLQSVLLGNAQGTPELDRDDHSSKFVDFSNNSSGLQDILPLLMCETSTIFAVNKGYHLFH
jgi:hypothetical protein